MEFKDNNIFISPSKGNYFCEMSSYRKHKFPKPKSLNLIYVTFIPYPANVENMVSF